MELHPNYKAQTDKGGRNHTCPICGEHIPKGIKGKPEHIKKHHPELPFFMKPVEVNKGNGNLAEHRLVFCKTCGAKAGGWEGLVKSHDHQKVVSTEDTGNSYDPITGFTPQKLAMGIQNSIIGMSREIEKLKRQLSNAYINYNNLKGKYDELTNKETSPEGATKE